MSAELAPEIPVEAEVVPIRKPDLRRHPANVHFDHLDPFLKRREDLRGRRVARLAENLRDGLVMGV